jgi:hypothetical protein
VSVCLYTRTVGFAKHTRTHTRTHTHTFTYNSYIQRLSSIYLQFLDAVHQVLQQFPDYFEFSGAFLETLAWTLHCGYFATFTLNDEKSRKLSNDRKVAFLSVWQLLAAERARFVNPSYALRSEASLDRVLLPETSVKILKLWTALYLRHDEVFVSSYAQIYDSKTEAKQNPTEVGSEAHTQDTVVWQSDVDCDACTKCSRKWSILNRRHHCRSCGRIFCASCASQTIIIEGNNTGKAERVCDSCFKRLNSGSKRMSINVENIH